jgi:cysteine desulfurase
MRKVYLDNNATTPIHPEVKDVMTNFLSEKFGNPSSIHWAGREAKKALEDAREKVAEIINAEPSEIVFTGSGTEANNMAIKGIAFQNLEKKGHIITSSVEHPSVLNTCKYLEKKGFEVTYLPVDSYGMIDPEDLKKSIKKNTILVSIMMANNEIGNIYPVKELASIAKENNIPFHCDAVQSLGKIEVDVKKLGVDLLSISAHKIYAPKGVGALYIRKGLKIEPLITGGHQEKNRRGGTENMIGIVGFGKACEIAKKEMNEVAERVRRLRDKLEKGIMEKIPDVKLNGHPEKRVPTTLNVSFLYVEGESILLNLDMEGIAASSGSACTSGTLDPSHVLTAMGISHEVAHGSIRFSLGRDTTEEDIDYVLEVLPPIIEKLRSYSPLYRKAKGGK